MVRLFRVVRLLSFLPFIMILPASASVPLKDYTERLKKAEQLTEELTEGEHPAGRVMKAMATLRRLLPQQEEVEFNSNIVRVDNTWLYEAIDKVIRNVEGDVEQRRSMLTEIAHRLSILEHRIVASYSQPQANIEEQRGRLERILARPEYRPEERKESALKRWLKPVWDAIIRFVNGLMSSPRKDPAGTGSLSWFRILVLLLALGALVIGSIHLIKRLRRRRQREEESKVREVLGEEIADDVTSADLLSEATELARRGDYRTAIRRGYIALLCELEQRGKLRLHRSKTNRDYLDILRSDREIFPPFAVMTGMFEKVWYGHTRATEEDFNSFISRYQETTNLKYGI